MPTHNAPTSEHWTAPKELTDLLNTTDSVKEKVAIVIGFYASLHGGNSPTMDEIADVLDIAKGNVEKRITQLVADGRAKRLHRKLFLVDSSYSHPLVKRYAVNDCH